MISVLDRYLTRLQIGSKSVPATEGPGKFYYPRGEPISKSTRYEKQMEADHAKQKIASLTAEAVCVYSDGSSCSPAKSF